MDLFILAGEPSGDLHAAKLIEALLKQNPSLKIGAVAGPEMRKLPIECIEPMERLQVIGFADVALALPRIARFFYRIRNVILSRKPKVFVGVDYPDFNLRMHRSLKKNGFQGRCVHYICPSVWAWRKGRIGFLEKWVDELLTILPFEPKCFEKTKLPVHYVGHPLTETIQNFVPDTTFPKHEKILALFPGSRTHEIQRNLPLMLQVADTLQKKDPALRVDISIVNKECEPWVRSIGGENALYTTDTQNLMHHAHMALAKSGTVTLELALHKVPTVVQYVIKPWDLFLAQKVFRISLSHYSLPNLLLQERVFPELFGPHLTNESLLAAAEELWFNEEKRKSCREQCERLWQVLGNQKASEVAAKHISL